MPTTIIPRSKRKTILLVLGSAAFVAIGWWLWNKDLSGHDALRRTEARIAAPVCMGFFGITLLFGLWKLFDNKPGLVLNEQGIYDRSSMMGEHYAHWDEVSGISELRIKRTRMLRIHLRDPEAFIARCPNKWKRRILRMNMGMGASPFVIAAVSLAIGFEGLKGTIEDHLKAHGGGKAERTG